jgi:SAM-dependent methyltransferase
MSECTAHPPITVDKAPDARENFGIASTVGPSPLGKFVAEDIVSNDAHWAWQNYKSVVLGLQATFHCESLLEVGAGRSPLLDKREYESLNAKYTVNDISSSELALAPEWASKAQFDISSPPTSARSSYDLIFSKMVFEHVRDAKAAYRAVYELLKPDGLCLTFFPTLYCLPFLVNYFSPERVSHQLQETFAPRRNPKFPAYYSWCRSTPALGRELLRIGFSDVIVLPFYGHAYYRSIPFLNEMNRRWTELARAKDWRSTSSFAYALMRK